MDEKTFIIKELMTENANLRVANIGLKYQLTQKEEELKHVNKEADIAKGTDLNA